MAISEREEENERAEQGKPSTENRRKSYLLKTGDVVASRIDFVNGAIAVVPEELDNTVASKEFIVLKPEKVSSNYLWLLLRTEYVRAREH